MLNKLNERKKSPQLTQRPKRNYKSGRCVKFVALGEKSLYLAAKRGLNLTDCWQTQMAASQRHDQ